MERIVYNKTLDAHKSGVQFTLQGFETADIMSRRIVISLMASGDAYDLPLEQMEAVMYVSTPGIEETSINVCTIKDNTIIYDALPITEEGITTMQLKLIGTRPDGVRGVLLAPKFAVEVIKSGAEDESIKGTASYTAVEEAISRAKAVYDTRLLRIALNSDCMFYAYYADGTIYESDVLKELFLKGEALLAESFARGGTGVRDGEDTDNAMYYSNVSKSEALNAKAIMEDSEEILEEVKLHGVYTAFQVDFETGEVEYVSPSFKFNINLETGELDAIGQSYTFYDEIGRVVTEWLEANNVVLSDLQAISETHTEEIEELQNRVTTVTNGGTGAATPKEALQNLGGLRFYESTYVGTGTWGPDNPNRLEFDGKPVFFSINGCVFGYGGGGRLIAIAEGGDRASYAYGLRITWGDNYIEWYADQSNTVYKPNNQTAQFNYAGSSYNYSVILM